MNTRQTVVISLAVSLMVAGCSHQAPRPVAQLARQPPATQQYSDMPVGPGAADAHTVQQQPAPGSCHYLNASNWQALPDPNCTPGAVDPAVRADNVVDTICRDDYAASVRPPAEITDPEEDADARAYGYNGPLDDAEYDHLIPIELGGDPNDPRNLWVEPGPASPKDTVQRQLHALVCSDKVALTDAQIAIAADWTTALASVGFPNGN
ncbi:hypothetical protein [Nocardia sp. NPDC051570]|uniref:hypothetical protein n=1 Tax=Nocardia sp. NPDC051570 TaxID=3364324 RepID=UPI00378FD8AF